MVQVYGNLSKGITELFTSKRKKTEPYNTIPKKELAKIIFTILKKTQKTRLLLTTN